jgi:hypothetical protein
MEAAVACGRLWHVGSVSLVSLVSNSVEFLHGGTTCPTYQPPLSPGASH